MNWEDFVAQVEQGKVDPDELEHALEMYRQYKTAIPKVQTMVQHLLETGAEIKTNPQD